MKGKKTTILIATLLIGVVATVSAAYLLHIMLTKPIYVNIIASPYLIELYSDSGGTTIAPSINFPDLTSDLSGGAVNVTGYWIRPIDPAGPTIWLTYNVTGLPEGLELVAWYHDGTGRVLWTDANPTYVRNGRTSADVSFGLIVMDSPPEGAYDFAINILASEEVA